MCVGSTIEIFGLFVDFIVGLGLVGVAFQANRIARNQRLDLRYKVAQHEREIFQSVYDIITNVLHHVNSDGRVSDAAKQLFWQARDEARLSLPSDIRQYTEQLFDEMRRADLLNFELSKEGGLPSGDRRSAVAKEHMDIIGMLIEERPYEIFRKHMQVKADTS